MAKASQKHFQSAAILCQSLCAPTAAASALSLYPCDSGRLLILCR